MTVERFLHGFLKIPYQLHIRYKRIKSPLSETYLLIHGLADTGELWQPLLAELPKDANYVVIDLLGHGKSKMPKNKSYSAVEQARNVRLTYLGLGVVGPLIVIGHSFGSLVAIELAKRHKRQVKQLVLCSPPIYRDPSSGKLSKLRRESILRDIYSQLVGQPRAVIAAYSLATKFKLAGFSKTRLTEDNFEAFTETLKGGIISQTAGKHLAETTVPTQIIYGALDPVVVPSNLAKLAKENSHISVKMLATSHAVTKTTLKAILQSIHQS